MLNIYVTNLGKYNEGYLIGEWVELPVSEEELQAVYNRIGINERYEEVFITDYETDISGLKVGEYDNISELNDLAEQLDELDDDEKDIVGALISDGYSLEDALDKKRRLSYLSQCGRYDRRGRTILRRNGDSRCNSG